MPGLFAESIIDEIREKCNIAEVIGHYIPLKPAGRNFKANCPFHHEKTPSFMVSPSKGIFHCFGCGAGGNVFNFIMKYEGLEFPQVLKILAKKTGVALPVSSAFAREEKVVDDIFQVNELAAAWFQNNLQLPAGRPAVEYLKKRGFQAKTLLNFRIGFAPENNGLLQYLSGRGVAQSLLEKAGLVIRKDNSPYYDRFKQRIMFPIFDNRGRIVAFGGRVMDSSLPKYMNSPDTPIYNKGNHLYGLNFAKEEIKKSDFCIIVEGYVDLLTVYQSGIYNVVASLGTALTTQQVRLLKRYSNNVVVVFDADRAGEMASLRSLDLLIEEDVHVKIASLSKDEDPDSMIRKHGKEAFWNKVTEAADLFEYKLKLLTQSHDLETVEGKVNIAAQMLPTIKRMQNAIRRGSYIKKLAQEFSRGEKSLGEEWILAELKKVKKDFQGHLGQEPLKLEVKVKRPAEEMLLKITIDSVDDSLIEIKKYLTLDDFQDIRIREAMRVVMRMHEHGEHVQEAKLINCLGSEEAGVFIARVCSSEREFDDLRKCLMDCIGRIKADNLKDTLHRLQREIKLAQSWGHKDKVLELMGKYNTLIKGQSKKNEDKKADA